MSLNTVTKCGTVLDLFPNERPEWDVTEIGEALKIPKSSAHFVASSLWATGTVNAHLGS